MIIHTVHQIFLSHPSVEHGGVVLPGLVISSGCSDVSRGDVWNF